MRIKQRQETGFTLVELLVVIIIIGILAAVAIPAFLNQRQRANDAVVQSDVKGISTAIESLIASNPPGAIVKASNGSSVESGSASEPVSISPGVSWNAYGSANGYCIVAWHSNAKSYTSSTPLRYDSVNGGMLPRGSTCGTLPKSPNGTTISGDGAVAEPSRYNWLGAAHSSASTETTISGQTRINLAANPSAEQTTSPWGHYAGAGGFANISRPSGNAYSGNQRVRATWTTAPTTKTAGMLYRHDSVTAGKTYASSMHVRTSKPQTVRFAYEWYTADGTRLPDVITENASVDSTGWTRLSGVATAPPGAVRVTITVYLNSSGTTWQVNDYMEADAVMIEEASSVGTYFDGSKTSTY